jgi:26S proteasome regulatory subunit T2
MFSQLLVGTPMSVGSLEEIIDDNHAIVSTSVGSEHYVSILSFVDKDQLEPGKFNLSLDNGFVVKT